MTISRRLHQRHYSFATATTTTAGTRSAAFYRLDDPDLRARPDEAFALVMALADDSVRDVTLRRCSHPVPSATEIASVHNDVLSFTATPACTTLSDQCTHAKSHIK